MRELGPGASVYLRFSPFDKVVPGQTWNIIAGENPLTATGLKSIVAPWTSILFVLVVAGAVSCSSMAFAQNRDEEWKQCQTSDADLAIVNCTAIIQSGQEAGPHLSSAFYNRANAYESKGAHDRAIQDYDEAIRLQPNYTNALVNRGTAHQSVGDFVRAILDYDAAIRLSPDDEIAVYDRGVAYVSKGQSERTIRDAAFLLKPREEDIVNDHGIAYNPIGKYDEAIRESNAVASLNQKTGSP
jgi:tetratricopeptide (TPR) repeat protein